ncbi:14820_t:CDS:2, partial [Gigaspora rosea]
MELAEALETTINEESNKTNYIYWKTQIPLTSSVITLPQVLFPEVDKALTFSITKAELIKYQEPELDTAQFIEDDEDLMQVSVNYVLVSESLLLEKEIKILQEENQSAEQTERFFAGED